MIHDYEDFAPWRDARPDGTVGDACRAFDATPLDMLLGWFARWNADRAAAAALNNRMIRDPADLARAFDGMPAETAARLVAEARQAADDQVPYPTTHGQFREETRDPMTGVLLTARLYQVVARRQASYRVVADPRVCAWCGHVAPARLTKPTGSGLSVCCADVAACRGRVVQAACDVAEAIGPIR